MARGLAVRRINKKEFRMVVTMLPRWGVNSEILNGK